MKKPRHRFRRPAREPDPKLCRQVDRLRSSRATIDPFEVFRYGLPDGSIVEVTGAELIATAEAAVSLFDAIRRGDSARVVAAALARLDRTFER